MSSSRLYGFVVAVLFAAAARPFAQDVGVDPSVKLTSVLQTLAGTVAQDDARAVAERQVNPARVSIDAMPKAVQDAVATRRLRITDERDVQVYILMSAVTDDRLDQLRQAGVTIEIPDTAHRRVQARVPASRLRLVAALPFVDFIRLPTYARRRVGMTTTEGDRILHADAARQQLSLDGTGVRVGVISDGLKGVFAKGCTNCSGVAGGPIATGDLPDAIGVRNAAGVLLSSSGGISGRSFQQNGDSKACRLRLRPAAFLAPAPRERRSSKLSTTSRRVRSCRSRMSTRTSHLYARSIRLASTNDIVVDDLGFFGDAFDGTSLVSTGTATALNNPAYPIRAYFTAVGNSADEHYYGTYQDSGIDVRT